MSESLRMRVVEAYKIGWSREQIIANVLFTADALREGR